MKKIIITEKQAKLLGIKKINEGEGNEPDSSISKMVSLGPDLRRIVISGEPLQKENIRNAVIKAILNRDKNSDAAYNELTNKIVSKKTDSNEFDAIKRNLKSINTGMDVEPKITGVGRSMEILANGLVVDTAPSAMKPTGVSKLKITKEQYNRIFASGLINEAMDPTDKQFKKYFAGADIKNLGEEENFDIKKKNPSLPSSIQGKFGKPLMETDEELKKETKDLIKYFYRKTDQFSPFWDKHGLTYDDIQDALKSRGLVVTENGMCELSKKFGTPEETIMAVENELRNLIGNKNETLKTEADGYLPAGAEYDRNAPWHDMDKARIPKKSLFDVIAYNRESAILKGRDGSLYYFYYGMIDKDDFSPYAEVSRDYIDKDEDGQPEFDYGDFDIDSDILGNYVNDNLNILTTGEGVDDWEDGVDLVKIDLPLKDELLKMYDKDKSFVEALGSINETEDSVFDKFSRSIIKATTPKENKPPKTKDDVIKMAKVLADLYEMPFEFYYEKLKARYGIEETTTAASSGAFTAPMGMTKREMPVDTNDLDVPVVGETTTAASSGQYTASAFAMKSPTEFSNKKPKAFKKTQYAGGAMVSFDKNCVGYNNSKKAQKGGCSQGAVDNVVKLKTTGSNVNAPSLSESSNNTPKAN